MLQASGNYWWVIDGCDVRSIPAGHYSYARTHGNALTVYYIPDPVTLSDYTPAWSERWLDYDNVANYTFVHC